MPGSIKEMGHNKYQYKKAGNLRAKIVSEIKMGAFVYKKTFPDSKTSPKFDPIQKISTFGELALSWYENHKSELSTNAARTYQTTVNLLERLVGSNTKLSSITNNNILIWREELSLGEKSYPPGVRKKQVALHER